MKKVWTPTRVVALVVIGVLVAGLAYLRFAPDEFAVSVPDGAKAGELAMHACTYTTEAGDVPADCGTLVVPETRTDPDPRLIALPVVRIPARSSDPKEPIFYLQGGPGISNVEIPWAGRFAEDHDVVLVGYRGVDGSVRLDCPEVGSALAHSTDVLGEAGFRAYADGFRACASRFADEGVDVRSYGIIDQVEDLEAARSALGYDRIDLLSESAGTRTAIIYAWRHPDSIHRSVMVAVNPPGNLGLWDRATTDEQIGRYAALCAKDDSCRARTDDLAASFDASLADVPDRWLLFPIDEGSVNVLSFFGLMESTSEAAPASGPIVVDALLGATEGDPSGMWFQTVLGELLFPEMFVWGQYAAFGSVDAQAAEVYFTGDDPRSSLGYAASSYVWGGGRMANGWPASYGADEYDIVSTTDVETLLIGGTLDGAAPPQNATKQYLPHLTNGRQVLLSDIGHTLDFWSYQSDASTTLITTFLDAGRVDDSGYRHATVDFTPEPNMRSMAKIVGSSIVGLALVMIVSLVWMTSRSRRRGRIGPKASAVLRSVLPIVLGLGGWALGVLIVTNLMPSVPIAGELFVAISMGVPIGLGVYLAWTDRDRSGSTRVIGFAAAIAGALVGAWLGFNAADGFGVLLTAIVGSAVGANLLVLLLDLTEARRSEIPVDPVQVIRVPERVDA